MKKTVLSLIGFLACVSTLWALPSEQGEIVPRPIIPPNNPFPDLRPRAIDKPIIVVDAEWEGFFVSIPEHADVVNLSMQHLISGECFILDVSDSCFIPIPCGSGAWMLSIEQNGQTVIAEVVIL